MLQSAVVVVVSLLTTDMILKELSQKKFDITQLIVIMSFVISTIVIEYVKELFTNRYHTVEEDVSSGSSIRHGYGYAHAFHQ